MKQNKDRASLIMKKKKIYDDLTKLANILNKKEEHKHSDRDDLDYFGKRELEIYLLMMMIIIIKQYQLEVLLKIIMNTIKLKEIKIKNYQ